MMRRSACREWPRIVLVQCRSTGRSADETSATRRRRRGAPLHSIDLQSDGTRPPAHRFPWPATRRQPRAARPGHTAGSHGSTCDGDSTNCMADCTWLIRCSRRSESSESGLKSQSNGSYVDESAAEGSAAVALSAETSTSVHSLPCAADLDHTDRD